MAVLRQERSTFKSSGSLGYFGRIYTVSIYIVSSFALVFPQCRLPRFDLHLDARLEYLTLAVGNAKSHPISADGRHETAIAFLTDLEEKLEVAQVQLEIYNQLLPHTNDAPEVEGMINRLFTRLFTLSEVRLLWFMPTS